MKMTTMAEVHMGEAEKRFADIIWENEPISSSELAKKALEVLSWKKTTAFTVLKRLSDKGLFKNEGGVVTSLMKREEYYARQSEMFVDQTFDGSLPAFLAAFSARKKLSDADIDELRRLVREYEEG